MAIQKIIIGLMQQFWQRRKAVSFSCVIFTIVVTVISACIGNGNMVGSPNNTNKNISDNTDISLSEQINKQSNDEEGDMEERVNQELKRLRELLRYERTKIALEEVSPLLDTDSIDALAGIGFKAKNPDVMISVYVLKSPDKYSQAVEKLKEEVPAEGMHILHGTNGLLLFFGFTNTHGPDGIKAKFRLSDLATAFAGVE